jgi:hypothetical protein
MNESFLVQGRKSSGFWILPSRREILAEFLEQVSRILSRNRGPVKVMQERNH